MQEPSLALMNTQYNQYFDIDLTGADIVVQARATPVAECLSVDRLKKELASSKKR